MIEQLLLLVGLSSSLAVATTAESLQPVAMEQVPRIVAGIVIVVCPNDLIKSDDAYTKAMTRLVAEQNQMAWIEQHIQKIEDDWNKVDKEIEKGMVSVINGVVKNAEAGGTGQKVLLDMQEKLNAKQRKNDDNREQRLKPWSTLHLKQVERIDKARESLEAVTPK